MNRMINDIGIIRYTFNAKFKVISIDLITRFHVLRDYEYNCNIHIHGVRNLLQSLPNLKQTKPGDCRQFDQLFSSYVTFANFDPITSFRINKKNCYRLKQ